MAPVYNEGPILAELAARCAEAAIAAGVSFEVLLIDDRSTDDTRNIADGLSTPGLRFVHLPDNRGQFRATQAGLREATGRHVVVLDGDLQDPPEVITELVARMESAAEDVVFAVKESRIDAGWMKLFAGAYGALQSLGRHPWPRGAGSFCVMTRERARQVARVRLVHANLGAVVIALGARPSTLPYRRAGRWDVDSHIGAVGLIKEALFSLALTGAAGRLFGAAALAVGLFAVFAGAHWRPLALLSAALATVTLGLALWIRGIVSEAVRPDTAP